jgi:hypothetical protein
LTVTILNLTSLQFFKELFIRSVMAAGRLDDLACPTFHHTTRTTE